MPLLDSHEPFHDPLEALDRFLSHFNHRGVIIGGIAVSLLSQPRFTEDLGAMVLLPMDDIPHFLAVAEKEGILPRIDQAEDFAKHSRVLLLRHELSQTNIDISLGVLPFEKEVVQRSVAHAIDDTLTIRLPTPKT